MTVTAEQLRKGREAVDALEQQHMRDFQCDYIKRPTRAKSTTEWNAPVFGLNPPRAKR